MRRWEKGLWMMGGTLLGGLMLMQFIPIWMIEPMMDPRNPPVQYEIEWASDEADSIMRMVCYTCHSNETRYPIYAQIAPVSWMAAEHVNQGRQQLNFSEQPMDEISMGRLIEYIQSDAMPPAEYRLTHPEANLSEAQKAVLIEGIRATFNSQQSAGLNRPTQ
jgi:hypothetical protein